MIKNLIFFLCRMSKTPNWRRELMNCVSKEMGSGTACNVERKTGLIWNSHQLCMYVGLSLSTLNRSKFHLRRHAETHIGGFSHLCQFCEKEFPHRAALKAHKLKAHPEHRVVKPFNCDLCDVASTSLIGLEAHKKRMHKM